MTTRTKTIVGDWAYRAVIVAMIGLNLAKQDRTYDEVVFVRISQAETTKELSSHDKRISSVESTVKANDEKDVVEHKSLAKAIQDNAQADDERDASIWTFLAYGKKQSKK